jgi:hypothetical protein
MSEGEFQTHRIVRDAIAQMPQAERGKVENVCEALRGIVKNNGAAGVLALALVATEVGE